jgi:molybdopterin-guanine dinucleotide biosynthesis protein A
LFLQLILSRNKAIAGFPKTRWYHFCVSRAGYVLVGGKSSRMGRDKALLPAPGGGTLGQYVARMVRRASGSAVLVGNPQRYAAPGYPAIPDLYPGEGPLGGILTALKHTSADWNLLTACDMPGLTESFLSRLLDAAEQSPAEALLPVGPAGRLEPLCGVYRKSALPALEAAFAAGVRQLSAAARRVPGLRMVPFEVSEVSIFQNVNTPEEWAAHGAD